MFEKFNLQHAYRQILCNSNHPLHHSNVADVSSSRGQTTVVSNLWAKHRVCISTWKWIKTLNLSPNLAHWIYFCKFVYIHPSWVRCSGTLLSNSLKRCWFDVCPVFALEAMLPLSPWDLINVCWPPSIALYFVQFFGTESAHLSWYEFPQSKHLLKKLNIILMFFEWMKKTKLTVSQSTLDPKAHVRSDCNALALYMNVFQNDADAHRHPVDEDRQKDGHASEFPMLNVCAIIDRANEQSHCWTMNVSSMNHFAVIPVYPKFDANSVVTDLFPLQPDAIHRAIEWTHPDRISLGYHSHWWRHVFVLSAAVILTTLNCYCLHGLNHCFHYAFPLSMTRNQSPRHHDYPCKLIPNHIAVHVLALHRYNNPIAQALQLNFVAAKRPYLDRQCT